MLIMFVNSKMNYRWWLRQRFVNIVISDIDRWSVILIGDQWSWYWVTACSLFSCFFSAKPRVRALCHSPRLCFSNRNKTLGPDGLSVEVYTHFWHKLGEILVLVFNFAIVKGDLPASMKARVSRLVHKKDDKRDLKNWRPISLLNID